MNEVLEAIGASGRKVSPEELSVGFQKLGLRKGDSLMVHASLASIGVVDGGAAMVLHRLLGAIGKSGTLLMPTFTRITTHASSHDNYTKPGCWCEGREGRHLPFILEIQPDKEMGEIAHRLCSWPGSRRSRHPAYSFVAVGKSGDELVRDHPPKDPLQPIKKMLKLNPRVLLLGADFEAATALHLAEERRTPAKFVSERALTVASRGQVWVEVLGIGCSKGFAKMKTRAAQIEHTETTIGSANAALYPIGPLLQAAELLLENDPMALSCDNEACLSCALTSTRSTNQIP